MNEVTKQTLRLCAFFLVLCAIATLFLSCKNRNTSYLNEIEIVHINDYSVFPKGAILSGEMNSGSTFYLIREDTAANKMEGFCFIDNNQAVVDKISFYADSTGKTTFYHNNSSYSGKMAVNTASEKIWLRLNEIVPLKIISQTIDLNYFGEIPEKKDCFEFFKENIFEEITTFPDLEYGTTKAYYVSKPFNPASEDNTMAIEAATIIYERCKGKLGLGKMKKEMRSLKLDIYSPKNNTNKLPLLLFIHGGAFLFGDKKINNELQETIMNHLVRKGFIVASINYRMGSLLSIGESINETFHLNIQDTRAALRFLMNNKDVKIDEKQVYLAGSSAGGIIALTTTFMDHSEVSATIKKKLGGLDDSGNSLKADYSIAGVISMWGAVSDLKIVNRPIPTLLFHGTEDKMVPCGKGMPFQNFLQNIDKITLELFKYKITDLTSEIFSLYGSCSIFEHSKKQNYPVKYVQFEGYGHDVHYNKETKSLNKENVNKICNHIGDFLFENVSKHYFNYELHGNTNVNNSEPAPVYCLKGNIGNISVQWYVEGGFITDNNNDYIRVIWYSSCETGTITACITSENGATCKKELKIRIL